MNMTSQLICKVTNYYPLPLQLALGKSALSSDRRGDQELHFQLLYNLKLEFNTYNSVDVG